MTLRPVHNGPVPLWSPAEERKEVCLLFSVDWNGDSGRREGRSEEEGGGEEKGEKRKLREKEGGGRGGRGCLALEDHDQTLGTRKKSSELYPILTHSSETREGIHPPKPAQEQGGQRASPGAPQVPTANFRGRCQSTHSIPQKGKLSLQRSVSFPSFWFFSIIVQSFFFFCSTGV
jgi:hypothetical protein